MHIYSRIYCIFFLSLFFVIPGCFVTLNLSNFRTSACFSKGISKYRGVSKYSLSLSRSFQVLSLSPHSQSYLWIRYGENSRWQARLGKGKDTKGLYVGSFGNTLKTIESWNYLDHIYQSSFHDQAHLYQIRDRDLQCNKVAVNKGVQIAKRIN